MNEAIYADTVRSRIAGLLRAYPDLEPAETAELLDFLARGSIIDVGYLRGDPQLKPIIDQVRADHPRRFRAGIVPTLLLLAMFAIPVFLLVAYSMAIAS